MRRAGLSGAGRRQHLAIARETRDDSCHDKVVGLRSLCRRAGNKQRFFQHFIGTARQETPCEFHIALRQLVRMETRNGSCHAWQGGGIEVTWAQCVWEVVGWTHHHCRHLVHHQQHHHHRCILGKDIEMERRKHEEMRSKFEDLSFCRPVRVYTDQIKNFPSPL